MKKTIRTTAKAQTNQQDPHISRPPKADAFLYPSKSARGLEIKEFCASYHVSLDTFTRLSGFSPRAVALWAQGRKPSESTGRRLIELKRIFDVLEQLVPPETIGLWLKQPNGAFDSSTPLQVIERGETDRIWRMIYELESGEPA